VSSRSLRRDISGSSSSSTAPNSTALGWSLFILTDPNAGHDVEGLVFAVARDKKRAAVIGLASRRRLYEIVERLRDTTPGGLDLRKVAGLLQRREGMLWGNSPVPENAPS
jgi:hypothetical protein